MTNEKNFRVEADLLGELKVPADALYGVQTQRGINNYHISRKTMRDYPDFIIANALVKMARRDGECGSRNAEGWHADTYHGGWRNNKRDACRPEDSTRISWCRGMGEGCCAKCGGIV